ncbi:MAPEG family protein [Roseovarius sp. SYSU LYC5161]|jgi:hypothetical protein|uniref:MAPEG family protein n=1 Tax=Roseovarius halophilus (ex Wu et al. 2025) TaxID=3376060 RepID=UPI003999E120
MPRGRAGLIIISLSLLWSVALLWGAARFVTLPVFTLMPTVMTAFLAPGLVLALMVARIGWRQRAGRQWRIDRHVLDVTVLQLVLALCIWPGAAVLLGSAGPGAITVLGVGFVISSLGHWLGAYLSRPLRDLGRAATFAPTMLVALWALASAAAYGSG